MESFGRVSVRSNTQALQGRAVCSCGRDALEAGPHPEKSQCPGDEASCSLYASMQSNLEESSIAGETQQIVRQTAQVLVRTMKVWNFSDSSTDEGQAPPAF